MLLILIFVRFFGHFHGVDHILQSLPRVHWWKLIRCPYIPYLVELLIAYRDDPAGHNMAKFLSKNMTQNGELFHGKYYDLLIIQSPAISADWLDEKYDYDGFVFLSKHAAESLKPVQDQKATRVHRSCKHTIRSLTKNEHDSNVL